MRPINSLDITKTRAFKTSIPLQVLVPSFNIRSEDGSFFTVPETTITVEDNRINYLMVDLWDKTVHCFRRALHTGGVFFAEITASGGQITDINGPDTLKVPRTHISKTRAKMKRANQIIIGNLYGDSITDGSGAGAREWRNLVFNSGNVAYGYNISAISQFVINNFAIGGQTPRLAWLQITGRAVIAGAGSHYWSTAVKNDIHRPSLGNAHLLSYTQRQRADFAIIMFGANSTTHQLSILENCVRELRRMGTEVIIRTQQPFAVDGISADADTNGQRTIGIDLKRIADVYGCEFDDTFAYVMEGWKKGGTMWIDSIHGSQTTKDVQAGSLLSIMDGVYRAPAEFGGIPNARMSLPNDAARYNFPAQCEVEFKPYATSGAPTTDQASTFNDALRNPAMDFGDKSLATSVGVVLDANNEMAFFSHPSWLSADIIVDTKDGNFSFEVYKSNGSGLLKTVNYTSGVQARVSILELLTLAEMDSAAQNQAYTNESTPGLTTPHANGGIQLKWVSGICNIIGVVFHTPRNRGIHWSEVDFQGTWAREAAASYIVANTKIPYTDTVGDSFSFKFKGNYAHFQLGSRSCSGKVDVYLDGKLVYADSDLYRAAGNYVITYPLLPTSIVQGDKARDAEHSVEVISKTPNASAAAVSAGQRRITLYDIREFFVH